MDDFETLLRTTLRDEKRAIPMWDEPATRIRNGMRRHRSAQLSTLAAIVIAAAIVTVGVGRLVDEKAPFNDFDVASGVPWSAESADPPSNMLRRDSRSDAQPCGPADLRGNAWWSPVRRDGRAGITVLLPNTGGSRCTIGGSATLVGVEGNSDPVPITGMPLADSSQSGRQYPATIDPGEPARIDVMPLDCPAGSGPPSYSRTSVVVLGKEYLLRDPALNGCGVAVGNWYVQAPLLNSTVTGRIEGPLTARRGETLRYQVTLSKLPDGVFSNKPCPVYAQEFGDEARWFRLNCAGLPATATATFQMEVRIPDDMPLGDSLLSWTAVMADGRAVVANVAQGGVMVRVSE